MEQDQVFGTVRTLARNDDPKQRQAGTEIVGNRYKKFQSHLYPPGKQPLLKGLLLTIRLMIL